MIFYQGPIIVDPGSNSFFGGRNFFLDIGQKKSDPGSFILDLGPFILDPRTFNFGPRVHIY